MNNPFKDDSVDNGTIDAAIENGKKDHEEKKQVILSGLTETLMDIRAFEFYLKAEGGCPDGDMERKSYERLLKDKKARFIALKIIAIAEGFAPDCLR